MSNNIKVVDMRNILCALDDQPPPTVESIDVDMYKEEDHVEAAVGIEAVLMSSKFIHRALTSASTGISGELRLGIPESLLDIVKRGKDGLKLFRDGLQRYKEAKASEEENRAPSGRSCGAGLH